MDRLRAAMLGACAVLAGTAHGAGLQSVASGNLGSSTTWSPQQTPSSADSLIIMPGHVVLLTSGSINAVNSMSIQAGGTLRFSVSGTATALLRFINGDLTVQPGGTVEMGT